MRTTSSTIFLALFVHLATSFDFQFTSSNSPNVWRYDGIRFNEVKVCRVPSLNITSPNEEITTINEGTRPAKCQILTMTSQTFHFIPKGVGKFFPELRALIAANTGLKSIQAADLEGLSHLEELNVPNNAIEVLPSDLFKSTPNIKKIEFSNNKISRVGKNLLKDLASLKFLNFYGNECVNIGPMAELEKIKNELQTKCPSPAGEIEITTLKPKSAREVALEKKIEKLKAENEHLRLTCGNGLLNSTEWDVVLKVVSVADNTAWLEVNFDSQELEVTKIINSAGNEVPLNQTEVVIHQQNALFLPVNFGRLLPSVQRLSVTFSGLTQLDRQSFKGIQDLTALNLAGNKLVEISENAFAELKALKELDLSYNNISIIHAEAFAPNLDLETLLLNNNALTVIHSPICEHQRKLRFLQLSDNKLKLIHSALLSASGALETVDFSGNICINMKYQKTDTSGTDLNNIRRHLERGCEG